MLTLHHTTSAGEEHVSVHLLCLPKAFVEAFQESLPPKASPAAIAEGICLIACQWPASSGLWVELNGDKPTGKSWASYNLVRAHFSIILSA